MTTVLVERRRNSVTNPALEVNATGWTAGGAATVARSTTRAHSGSASLLLTYGAGTAVTQSALTTITGLTVGVSYTVSAQLWVPAASLAAAPALFVVGIGPIGSVVSTPDAWVQIGASFTANATSLTVGVFNTGTTTAGLTTFIDEVSVQASAGAGNYFDGSTAATGSSVGDHTYAWSGTAHASVSVEYEIMARYAITATAEPAADPPRVRLDVVDQDPAPGPTVTVTRLDPDGRIVPVRTIDGYPLTLSAGVGLLYDYEAPLGAPVRYSTLEDPAASSAEVTLASSQVWLVHPGVPVLSMPVMVSALGARSRKVERAVHYPLGRATPVVQTDGQRKSAEYTLSLLTTSDDELASIQSLLDDSGTLLLNVPATKGWGLVSEYVSVGDLTEARVVRFPGEQMRTWELPCIVVDRPAGGSQAERTFVDVLVDNATFADLVTKYGTFLDLLAGP